MTVKRLTIEVVVRNVVVAVAIRSIYEEDRATVLRFLEDQVRQELHVPVQYTVIARSVPALERELNHNSRIFNDFRLTGNVVDLNAPRMSSRANARCFAKVARQQAIARENRLYHGDNQSPRAGKGNNHSSKS